MTKNEIEDYLILRLTPSRKFPPAPESNLYLPRRKKIKLQQLFFSLLKFKKGAFLTAIKNEVPVIPITISGSREFLRSESWLPRKVTLVISISPPIETKDKNITADEISMQSREMILSKLNEPDLNHKSFKG